MTGPLKFFLFMCFLMYLWISTIAEHKAQQAPQQVVKQEVACDEKLGEKYVNTAIQELGVFQKIRTTSSIPKVIVNPSWYVLNFENKQTLDYAVLCAYRTKIVVYLDAYTGQEVATSGAFGFSMS